MEENSMKISLSNPFNDGVISEEISNIHIFLKIEGKRKDYDVYLNAHGELEIRQNRGGNINIIPKCSNVIALK